jgi:hypothetical protein
MPNITYTELERLLKKADECAIAAILAAEPEAREMNEKLAHEYFQEAEKIAASHICWA